jgi:hypothetical protein
VGGPYNPLVHGSCFCLTKAIATGRARAIMITPIVINQVFRLNFLVKDRFSLGGR